jgi:hypothetical protein
MHPQRRKVNNLEWVQQHRNSLFPEDASQTFQVVLARHPNYGAAEMPIPHVNRLHGLLSSLRPQPEQEGGQQQKKALEELAAFADAVTVCCYEGLGRHVQPTQGLEKPNATTLGNLAFIASHHSGRAVREKYKGVLLSMASRNYCSRS